MASIGKTESQIEHFRKNNEILLSPPIKYILDLCGNPLMAIISNKKLKGKDFSKARMRITSALSKLMCTEEMSENYNNPINYSLILALDQGFEGDSEVQAILHEAPALIGLNPNARAYYEHMLRSIRLIVNLLSRCDIPIYRHSDYDYAHQRFFVSAKCLFGWISLRTRSKNTDLENLKVGLKIVKRLLGFTTKVNPVRKRVLSDTGMEKSSENNQSQYESDDNVDSVDMDENTFFKKYMEETKDSEEVELIKTSSKLKSFGINKKNSGKIPSMQFISERKDTSKFEKIQPKRLRSSTGVDQMVYKNFVLDEDLKESLNGVIFSLNATLFNNTEAKDLICKFSFQKMLINIGKKAVKSEEIFDVGLDLVIAQKSLLNKSNKVKNDQETSYFYIINDSITSFTKLAPKKSKSLTVPVLITTRNVNGKYSSIISNVNPEHLDNRNKSIHHADKSSDLFIGKNDTSNPMRIFLKSSEVIKKRDSNNEEPKKNDGIEDNYLALSSGDFLNSINRNKSDYNLYKGKLGNERKEDLLIKRNLSCEFIFDSDVKKRNKGIKKPYFLNSIIGIDDSRNRDTGNIPIISLPSGSPDTRSKGDIVLSNENNNLEKDLNQLFRLSLEKMESEDINIKKSSSTSNKDKEVYAAKREAGNTSTKINESIETLKPLDIKLEKNPTPWVHSARAERLAMSQSKARDARGYSSLSVDMLPKLNDISNTTMMSDLIRKDSEKRSTQINNSNHNNQFKPIQPTSESEIIKNSGNLPSSFLLKPIINSQLHSPIEINEDLIRQLTLLDCLDSSFMMRVNVVYFKSPLNAISKNYASFKNKDEIPEELYQMLKTLGKKVENNAANLNFGLSSHLGFRNINKKNILFQISPNLSPPKTKVIERSYIDQDYPGGLVDDSFIKNLDNDKHQFYKNITRENENNINTTNKIKSYQSRFIVSDGLNKSESPEDTVKDSCLEKFFKCALQDSIVLVYASSGIEDINMQYFWEKISNSYSKLKYPSSVPKFKDTNSNHSTLNSPASVASFNSSVSSRVSFLSSSESETESINKDMPKISIKNDSNSVEKIAARSRSKSELNAPKIKEGTLNIKTMSLDVNSLNNYNMVPKIIKDSKGDSIPESVAYASAEKNEIKEKCDKCLNSEFDLFDILEPATESNLVSKPKFAILLCPVRATKGQMFRVRLVATSKDAEIRESLLSNTGPLISGMSVHYTQLPLLLLVTLIEAKKNLLSLENGNFSTLAKRKNMIDSIRKEYSIYDTDDKTGKLSHFLKNFST
ncbi:hypothetical protein AYI70_g5322 [Smittium culicis]|uniref:Uncharacterized protein n=1 Tax=Smittium culicis TaxID=133412 RepID=A0A1R1XV19_9FUNG|nr:hypothetical protein AYI70_g5322 [Smittium culicis]